LNWVLVQKDGDFVVTVISSDGQASHVVGVRAGRRLIFDHEDPISLPFNTTGFDAACSGTNTCAGLGVVKRVGFKDMKKPKRKRRY
jgi:hypothetical protein